LQLVTSRLADEVSSLKGILARKDAELGGLGDIVRELRHEIDTTHRLRERHARTVQEQLDVAHAEAAASRQESEKHARHIAALEDELADCGLRIHSFVAELESARAEHCRLEAATKQQSALHEACMHSIQADCNAAKQATAAAEAKAAEVANAHTRELAQVHQVLRDHKASSAMREAQQAKQLQDIMQLLEAEGERSVRLEAALANLQTDLVTTQSEFEEVSAHVSRWKDQAMELQDEVSALKHRGNADRLLLAERADETAAARHELVVLQRRESMALQRIDGLTSELDSKGKQIDLLERRIASEAERRKETEARAARLEAECNEAQARILEEREVQRSEVEMLVAKQQRLEVARQQAEAQLHEAAAVATLHAEAEEARFSTMQHAVEQSMQEVSEYEARDSASRKKLAEVTELLHSFEDGCRAREAHLREQLQHEAARQLGDALESLRTTERQVEATQRRCELLDEQASAHEQAAAQQELLLQQARSECAFAQEQLAAVRAQHELQAAASAELLTQREEHALSTATALRHSSQQWESTAATAATLLHEAVAELRQTRRMTVELARASEDAEAALETMTAIKCSLLEEVRPHRWCAGAYATTNPSTATLTTAYPTTVQS
jgi:hypothetical protein